MNKKTNSIGLGIALGAGMGIIFGEFVFNDVGIGLVVGTGIGIVLGGAYSAKSNKNSKNDQ